MPATAEFSTSWNSGEYPRLGRLVLQQALLPDDVLQKDDPCIYHVVQVSSISLKQTALASPGLDSPHPALSAATKMQWRLALCLLKNSTSTTRI